MKSNGVDITPRSQSTIRTIVAFFGLYLILGLLRRGATMLTSALLSSGVEGFTVDAIRFGGALLALVLTVGLVILYARYGEGRSLRSMGFVPQSALREYLKGAGIGLALIGAVLLLAWAGGGVDFIGMGDDFSIVTFGAASLLGMLNIREEVLFRGWFTTSLQKSAGTAVAICVVSIAFGAVHITNPNVTVLSIVNITLLGAFLGLYFLRTGNIWGVAAIHTFWNFAQNRICGLPMSGMAARGSLLRFEGTEDGFFGVGAFGLEGSPVATAVLIVAIVLTVKKFSTFVTFNGNTK